MFTLPAAAELDPFGGDTDVRAPEDCRLSLGFDDIAERTKMTLKLQRRVPDAICGSSRRGEPLSDSPGSRGGLIPRTRDLDARITALC